MSQPIPEPLPAAAPAAPDQAPAAAPAPADLEYRLHPQTVQLWRWQARIVAVAGPVPAVITFLALGWWWAVPPVVAAAAALLWWAHHYVRHYYARFRCALLDDGLLVQRGVLWRSETFVPRARVQHTDVDQGPIARRFGIATLKVFTAGSRTSEIEVDGLAHADALRLRDEMLGRRGS